MSALQFAFECGNRLIHVDVALENEAIREALAERNDTKVVELLETEF
jgi:hypothetical protein